jgi:hypothetical protein
MVEGKMDCGATGESLKSLKLNYFSIDNRSAWRIKFTAEVRPPVPRPFEFVCAVPGRPEERETVFPEFGFEFLS